MAKKDKNDDEAAGEPEVKLTAVTTLLPDPNDAKHNPNLLVETLRKAPAKNHPRARSDAASFLPTDDLPVPIMPTRNTLEPSSTSFTAAAVSASPPASHRIDRRRATARLAGRAGARRDASPARGAM